MKKVKKKKKNRGSTILRTTLSFFVIVAMLLAYEFVTDGSFLNKNGSVDYSKEILYVDFIDVGQGDSILIRTSGDDAILIDAGTSSSKDHIIEFLNSKEVDDIDLFVLTHPHADHIGSAKAVIEEFAVDKILMPNAVSTSKTFEDLIDTIAEKEIETEEAEVGKKYVFGEAEFTVLAPIGKFDDLNNMSVVLHLTYGESTFLFTGDAEIISEERIIQSGFDIDVDLLKVGHHGSSTSTSDEFLNTTTPLFAIISVGEGNSYNHPSKSTLEKLERLNITVMRTDILSDITFASDGKNIEKVA